jgi:hypothetical protein
MVAMPTTNFSQLSSRALRWNLENRGTHEPSTALQVIYKQAGSNSFHDGRELQAAHNMPKEPKTLSRGEERRGTGRVIVGSVIAAFVIGLAIAFWPWWVGYQSPQTAVTGSRSNQIAGRSTAGKQTTPPQSAGTNSGTPQTVGRAHDITSTATNNLNLNASQRKAVDDFATQHQQQKVDHVDFTVSVGAAVPKKVQLRDLPSQLADALSGYKADQYLILPKQLVIVEKQTRRIVALIPLST